MSRMDVPFPDNYEDWIVGLYAPGQRDRELRAARVHPRRLDPLCGHCRDARARPWADRDTFAGRCAFAGRVTRFVTLVLVLFVLVTGDWQPLSGLVTYLAATGLFIAADARRSREGP